MSTTLTLVDGATATIRDAAEVPEGRRRELATVMTDLLQIAPELANVAAMRDAGVDLSQIEVPPAHYGAIMTGMGRLIDANIVAFVKEWSYPHPITAETLLNELPSAVYEQLRDLTLPQMTAILPRFDLGSNVVGTTPEGAPIVDRAGPTPPSAG